MKESDHSFLTKEMRLGIVRFAGLTYMILLYVIYFMAHNRITRFGILFRSFNRTSP